VVAVKTSPRPERPRVVAPQLHQRVRLILVGCGGTGSWLAPHIARLVFLLREQGKDASALFVDPDVVEEPRNIPRQNFCHAEARARLPKAVTLARRFGSAWGLEIPAVVEPFRPGMASSSGFHGGLTVLVGCVDNHLGRQALAEALRTGYGEHPRWWLDCGNHMSSGQVLLGNVTRPEEVKQGLKAARLCIHLPAPSWQHPELLEAPPAEERSGPPRSCAQIALENAQALNINVVVAAIAAEYLNQLLLAGTLTTFATYVNLAPLTVSSYPITDGYLARFLPTPLGSC
jgi:PRTRC genetic system ThiF family protein